MVTGYGVVESRENRTRCLEYGAIKNPSNVPHPERLRKIFVGLKDVIRKHRPTLLALEGVFLAKNVQSAFKLGQVRGAVMVLAMEEGLELRDAAHLRPTTIPDTEAGAPPVPGFVPNPATAGLAGAEAEFLRRHFQRGGSAGYEHEGVPEGQGELFGAAATQAAGDAAEAAAVATDEPALHTAPF